MWEKALQTFPEFYALVEKQTNEFIATAKITDGDVLIDTKHKITLAIAKTRTISASVPAATATVVK